MKNIILKWMLISLGVGLIPVLILGASPGGVALSPIILMLIFLAGLVGATVHANIYAYREGSKNQKRKGLALGVVSVLIVSLLIYSESRCELNSEYATERAVKYVSSKEELDIDYLGVGHFNLDECVCTFEYSSPNKSFTIFVTEYGELHFTPH